MASQPQSQQKPQQNQSSYENQLIILAMILNLPHKYLNFIGTIFKGKKRYKKLFYSLTTIGAFIGDYERSTAGKFAKHLHFLGLIKMEEVTIHGTYVWELGDQLTHPLIYAHLHKYFMGLGIMDLLSKLPLDRKFPLYNINKPKSFLNEEKARGRSPRSALRPTKKEPKMGYNERWDYSRWFMWNKITGEPNPKLTLQEFEALIA